MKISGLKVWKRWSKFGVLAEPEHCEDSCKAIVLKIHQILARKNELSRELEDIAYKEAETMDKGETYTETQTVETNFGEREYLITRGKYSDLILSEKLLD